MPPATGRIGGLCPRGKEVSDRVVRPDKQELVQGVSEQLRKAQSIVLTDFQGITVAEVNDLRSQLRGQGVQMRVIKNRLLRRALEEAGCDPIDEMLVGNTAVAFGVDEPAAPAKVLLAYAKKNDKIKIKGGLLEKRRLTAAGIQDLAKLPGRRELLAIIAGDFKQPASKMAVVMQQGLLKVAYAMQALADKQEKTDAAA